MSKTFLAVSILGLAVTVNAWRPVPRTAIAVPSFFASWLTMELAPHHLILHLAAVSYFVATGAVDGWQGWIALVLAILTTAGLVGLMIQAQRVRDLVERALCEGLGEDYRTKILPQRTAAYDLRTPWRQLVLPFRMRNPDVVRVRNRSYGEVKRRNRIDVYHHRAMPKDAPVLLQIHGGGWMISNKDQQGKPIMLHLASKGWVCFAPNYRMSPRATWPAHVIDCKRALAWVREHAHEYGGDPGFVVVTGGSAGGHLAALMALSQNDPEFQPGFEDADTTLQGAIPHYGIYDMANEAAIKAARARTKFVERIVFRRSVAEAPEMYRAASPHFRVTPDAPPFLVIHGERDSLVPVEEARRFVARLREISRAPVVYCELPGAQHAFDVFPSIRTAHVTRAVERFLDFIYSEHVTAEAARRVPGHPATEER